MSCRTDLWEESVDPVSRLLCSDLQSKGMGQGHGAREETPLQHPERSRLQGAREAP